MDHSDELWIRAMIEILEAKINQCNSRIDGVVKDFEPIIKSADDREQRIRDLEKFQWKLIGAAAAAGAAAGFSINFLL